ncbi:MAG TPA: hypothetical protein VLA16_13110 [Ideonella sp.]|nr:hypothetical protein [Ideonella sp.]
MPRLLRVEPPRDSARHVGDRVVYRALIAWPPGWEIDHDGLPAPTREDGPVELRSHRVEPAEQACPGCRWLVLEWQVFKAVHTTADVPLPATPLRLRKGTRIATLLLPASTLAVSPLVPWERRPDWVASARPGWQPQAFDVRGRLVELGAWLCAALLALVGWAWSSGRWLPRRGVRPFAQAWRSVRARPRAGAGELRQADADDLRCWHRAFDATAGEAVFAENLDVFFARHPALAPLAGEVRAVFAASQRAFYLDPKAEPATRLALQDLVSLLQRLAEREFGAARALGTGSGDARV